ncbi:MAG: hypothetical protein A3K22_05905 [Deltaproteobacteria bacterium RBG_16_42_7]|nr:MAG: hypothetical protein A3K22_05905 [Deltaproteobacteria bacterium RBG_16_42_7]
MATIPTDLERMNYGGPAGCIAPGQHRQVIGDAVATRTLLAEESGALCLLDRAAGVVYTLPTPVAGMTFEFLVVVSVTSNAHKVITHANTAFLLGGVLAGDVTIATSGPYFEANGSTIRALSANGSTSGGLLGERYVVTALTSTYWGIHGVTHGAGTLITPFATS